MTPSDLKDQNKDKIHLPGEVGIWMFVFGDMLLFGLFFIVFVSERSKNLELYTASQNTLNANLGAINTLLLLTSSWLVAKGVRAAKIDRSRPVSTWFLFALVCGLGFVINKVFEYHEKVSAGITLVTNDFYMYYFMFTGIHLVHVLIGLGVLIYLWMLTRSSLAGKNDVVLIECGATFWHLVDLLWIVLFPLLYLLR